MERKKAKPAVPARNDNNTNRGRNAKKGNKGQNKKKAEIKADKDVKKEKDGEKKDEAEVKKEGEEVKEGEETTADGEKKKSKYDEFPTSLLVCKICQKVMSDGAVSVLNTVLILLKNLYT